MVKYKLIKIYPGSPKLGTEIIESKIYSNILPNKITTFMKKGDDCFSIKKPENYPEFWELVVEKDYEILAYLTGSGAYSTNIVYFNPECNTIQSIKRLSDGEIFTIGDKVFSEYVNYTINKIGIVNDKCMVSALYDTNNPNGSRLHYNLNNLKKAKQPLLITADGVDIFEGDIYYSINTSCWLEFETKGSFSNLLHPLFKHFSTKENLKEYILMNKPVLSLSDVWDNLKVKDQKEVLKFVKSKLK